MSTDSRFLFTENVQFSYVSLRCTSSGQRTRSRHGRKAGEEDGSSIMAEFELDVNLEEVTGWSLCAPPLPACLPACLQPWLLSLPPFFFPPRCCLFVTKQTVKVSPVLTRLWWWWWAAGWGTELVYFLELLGRGGFSCHGGAYMSSV